MVEEQQDEEEAESVPYILFDMFTSPLYEGPLVYRIPYWGALITLLALVIQWVMMHV